MKSGKQRRAEIKASRVAAGQARAHIDPRFTIHAAGAPQLLSGASQLAPDKSYGVPVFVTRGCYVDVSFRCVDCGAEGVWTAERQKWWYEVAKGGVWTCANRCRECRANKREQREASRAAYCEGMLRKLARMAQ